MPNPVADVLRRAAARVAKGGIVKNRDHFAESEGGNEVSPHSRAACRWCATGCLKADRTYYSDFHLYAAARGVLDASLGRSAIQWFYGFGAKRRPNKREVVAALRAAADAAEGQGGA